MVRRRAILYACMLLTLVVLASACGSPSAATSASNSSSGKKTIVVTHSVLGSVVRELASSQANVVVLIPNGQDPHEWGPSAKDIETLYRANLVVQNGLNLEGGLQKTLTQVRQSGVHFFTASDHIVVRKVGPGEGIPSGDPDQSVGASDPHLWMDPLTIKMVVDALAVQLKSDLGIDTSDQAKQMDAKLDALNKEIADEVATIPATNRKLVTGHESMGYFAQRYGFKLVGAIIPSLSSQAEVSASDLAALKKQIQDNQVKAVFTELGTPPAVAQAIGQETGVKVVQLSAHTLPPDGSYFTFMRNVAKTVTDALR